MVQTGGFPFRDVKHVPLPGGNGSSNDHFQGAVQWSDLTCWLWSHTTCAQTLLLISSVTWFSYLTSLSLSSLIHKMITYFISGFMRASMLLHNYCSL